MKMRESVKPVQRRSIKRSSGVTITQSMYCVTPQDTLSEKVPSV